MLFWRVHVPVVSRDTGLVLCLWLEVGGWRLFQVTCWERQTVLKRPGIFCVDLGDLPLAHISAQGMAVKTATNQFVASISLLNEENGGFMSSLVHPKVSSKLHAGTLDMDPQTTGDNGPWRPRNGTPSSGRDRLPERTGTAYRPHSSCPRHKFDSIRYLLIGI